MFIEAIKFVFYSVLIVIISKYILVTYLRKLAEGLNLKAKTAGNIAGAATSMPELLTVGASSLRGFVRSEYIQYFKFKCNKFNSIFGNNSFE